MKNSVTAFLIAGILTLAASAKAGIFTISFDELKVGEDVLGYYNGGWGDLGSGPGPRYGVSFGSGWIAGPPDVYHGYSSGNSAAISGTAIMNVAAGWSGSYFSFYYFGSALTVKFYDEQDGGGTLMGTWNLPQTFSFSPAGDYFGAQGFPFRSAVFFGVDRIDPLTNAGEVVPEPGAGQLFLLGIVGVFSLTALRRSLHSAGERFAPTAPGHGSG